jgi:ABC-type oligopeptide transport system ATPase subunit
MLLEVHQLTKHFPIKGSRAVVQAVNGVSFALERGRTLGLIGESGSGKTTVGRCILK